MTRAGPDRPIRVRVILDKPIDNRRAQRITPLSAQAREELPFLTLQLN